MYSLFTPRVIGKKNSPWCVIGHPLSQGKGKGPGNEAGDLIEKFSVVRDWYAPPSSTATLEIFEKRKTTNLLLKHRQLRPSDKCKPVKLLITFRCRRIHFHNFTLLSDKRFWNSWKTVMITYAVTLKWELLYFFVLLLVRYKQSGANFLTIAWNHLAKGLLWVCLRMGEDDSASARNLLFFFYSLR